MTNFVESIDTRILKHGSSDGGDHGIRTIGVLTIGQSPRPDRLGHDIQAVLGHNTQIVECGALDGLSDEDYQGLAPGDSSEYRLITLLRDGRSVEVSKQAILALLQNQIHDLENRQDVDAILLMCTGSFPSFSHEKPLLLPQEALYGAVMGMAGHGQIGALIPLESQLEQSQRKWQELGISGVQLFPCSPYGNDPAGDVAVAARSARDAGVEILFMDCFGYDVAMKSAARQVFGGPVVLARTLAARFIAELSE